jgi:pimeloyl-ACP methyl ester carboxylesterase
MVLATGDQIRLRDGRLLGFAEYGDPRGAPVLYFHGLPGSRLDARLTEPVASQVGARVIAIDRPGFGLSDFQPGRQILDWPKDVGELGDHLGLPRFAVMGVSGGGPYAAACALKIPHRLSNAGIICGVGPIDTPTATHGMSRFSRFSLFLSRRFPTLVHPFCATATRVLLRNPGRFHLGAALCPLDREALERPEIESILSASFIEAARAGARGMAWDLALHGQPWGFSLRQIPIKVHLWHGERDDTVPAHMGRYIARTIPHCRAWFYPHDGHFSLPVNRMEEILQRLLRVSPTSLPRQRASSPAASP